MAAATLLQACGGPQTQSLEDESIRPRFSSNARVDVPLYIRKCTDADKEPSDGVIYRAFGSSTVLNDLGGTAVDIAFGAAVSTARSKMAAAFKETIDGTGGTIRGIDGKVPSLDALSQALNTFTATIYDSPAICGGAYEENAEYTVNVIVATKVNPNVIEDAYRRMTGLDKTSGGAGSPAKRDVGMTGATKEQFNTWKEVFTKKLNEELVTLRPAQ